MGSSSFRQANAKMTRRTAHKIKDLCLNPVPILPWYALAPKTYSDRKINVGSNGLRKVILRLRNNNPKIIRKKLTQAKFSNAARRLDVLVASSPRIGRNRNVETIYGALHAMQK
jgi:hypothetical protein